jgi:arsenite methyltransferase
MSEAEQCSSTADPLDQIRSLYTELAMRPDQDFGWRKGKDNSRRLGYAEEWLLRLPEVVWESAAAVGNPFSIGPIHPGEVVVDLGCGAGADALVAALLVGAKGKVHGFDATPAMVDKATRNAATAGLDQAGFHCADMTKLGLPDAVADVVISNGAINLSQDKAAVFAEVFRVLKTRGRFQFADMVREHTAAPACCSTDSWADCVAGTLGVEEIMALLRQAGFEGVELVGLTGYKTSLSTVGALLRATRP